jgi:nucleoid-associated protein YgaU
MGIFEQIKNAFSKGESERLEEPVIEPAADTPEPEPVRVDSYTVQSGDTLWRIADTLYGDGEKYVDIFEANREELESPDRILPGQVLHIP